MVGGNGVSPVQINFWIGFFVILLVGDMMGEKKKALR
jgi:hypothetical protein